MVSVNCSLVETHSYYSPSQAFISLLILFPNGFLTFWLFLGLDDSETARQRRVLALQRARQLNILMVNAAPNDLKTTSK